jgi:hypothetical protein
MRKNNTIVMGICMPRSLKEIIDKTRGDIPRSTYISKILEGHIHTENRNRDYVGEDQQSKSRGQPGHSSANSSALPFTDHVGVVDG